MRSHNLNNYMQLRSLDLSSIVHSKLSLGRSFIKNVHHPITDKWHNAPIPLLEVHNLNLISKDSNQSLAFMRSIAPLSRLVNLLEMPTYSKHSRGNDLLVMCLIPLVVPIA